MKLFAGCEGGKDLWCSIDCASATLCTSSPSQYPCSIASSNWDLCLTMAVTPRTLCIKISLFSHQGWNIIKFFLVYLPPMLKQESFIFFWMHIAKKKVRRVLLCEMSWIRASLKKKVYGAGKSFFVLSLNVCLYSWGYYSVNVDGKFEFLISLCNVD